MMSVYGRSCESEENPSHTNHWFALAVRSNHEKAVSAALRSRGFEEFLPLCTVRRKWADRYKSLQLPLFPGYVFCHFPLFSRIAVLATPGVACVIGRGSTPEPVSETEILNIQRVVTSEFPIHPCEFIATGQRAVITSGALEGVEGIVQKVKGNLRLVMSIDLLRRSVAVEIETERVKSVGGAAEDVKSLDTGYSSHLSGRFSQNATCS